MSKSLLVSFVSVALFTAACGHHNDTADTHASNVASMKLPWIQEAIVDLKALTGERITLEYRDTKLFTAQDSRSSSLFAMNVLINVYARCDLADSLEAHVYAEYCSGCYAGQVTPWDWKQHDDGVRKVRLEKYAGSYGTCTYSGRLDRIFIEGSGYGWGVPARQQISVYRLGAPVDADRSWLTDPISRTHNFIFDLRQAARSSH